MYGLKPTQIISVHVTANDVGSIKNIPILSLGKNGKMTKTPEQIEADELIQLMGITSDWVVENIKETAMNRFNVKNGKRPHIKRILDDTFQQLKEKSEKYNGRV